MGGKNFKWFAGLYENRKLTTVNPPLQGRAPLMILPQNQPFFHFFQQDLKLLLYMWATFSLLEWAGYPSGMNYSGASNLRTDI
jgi:hypothetical protein